jgi:ribosomal protein S18 acetylase RimI-like enzyme
MVNKGSQSMVDVIIRPYRDSDEPGVIDLWYRCNLVVPWNDPAGDIAMKRSMQPELFFVGSRDGGIVSTAMAGYDGHRGWIYYLAVDPDCQGNGYARRMVERVEKTLRDLGCRKINLQVRSSNRSVLSFYEHLGFSVDDVIGLGKRL